MRKIFEMKALRWLENAAFRLDFANTAIHKRAMLLIFYTDYTESVLNILTYLECAMGPEKIFKMNVNRRLESCKIGICKYIKCFH